MTEDDRRLLQGWDDQLGLTLGKNYDLVKALLRVPLCAVCPMAKWYKLEEAPAKEGEKPPPPRLECFCTAYHGVMYDGRRVVTACDAWEDAIKREDDEPG